MENISDTRPDPARSLPREAFAEIILVLRGALPAPVSDAPADEARRDKAAMAAVASLCPANAAEGRLAAQFVVADAWAMDCLKLANVKRLEPDIARKCQAQAMSLMREAKSSLRLLLSVQAMRRATEADAAAAERAAWTEHGAAAMMAEALAEDAAGVGAAGADAAGVVTPRGTASRKLGRDRLAVVAARPDAGSGEFGFVAEDEAGFGNARVETEARFLPPGPAVL